MSALASKTWQDYEVLGVLGNGAFGTCYKVRDKASGQLYAWKGMSYDEDLSEQQQESLISEIQVLRQLHHPNIVQYHHHLVNHEARSLYIVMEYCEGGDLSQLITQARQQHRRFEESYIWRALFQMCRALQICHNKIQAGTILHRDIKPANIFLDGNGNVKLGDFGLARMLRRHESFAETFVGTPYYMSPEIVKGSKYDRKSDVWALGCLTYEMCALKPPFRGREFQQLSTQIANGKFAGLPKVYSADLEYIISYMLEVDSEQRPSVEIVARHPIVVRNITHLSKDFPRLLEMEQDDGVLITPNTSPRKSYKSEYRSLHSSWQDLTNTPTSKRVGLYSDCGTPELKAELFYSARRRIFGAINPTDPMQRQQSDPAIYESIRHEDYVRLITHVPPVPLRPIQKTITERRRTSPAQLTKDLVEQALQERLQNIRAHESLLRLKEESLNTRERQLNERERRLVEREQQLTERELEEKAQKRLSLSSTSNPKTTIPEVNKVDGKGVGQTSTQHPPPRPPKKPILRHDDTYCSIDPLDTSPTVAKMDLNVLAAASRTMPQVRRVTFQSPKRFITYDIEGGGGSTGGERTANGVPMQSSTSSKESEHSTELNTGKKRPHKSNNGSSHRRKSLFSILGLSRLNNKDNNTMAQKTFESCNNSIPEKGNHPVPSTGPPPTIPLMKIDPACILAKCETTELSNIWTEEHKKAAFQMLAALNATGTDGVKNSIEVTITAPTQRHKTRQSVRERNNLQRNRLRRSLVATSNTVAINCSTPRKSMAPEKIII